MLRKNGIFIGVLSILSNLLILIYLGFFFLIMIKSIFFEINASFIGIYFFFFILAAIASLISILLLFYYTVHLARNGELDERKRFAWLFFFYLTGGFAFIIYWYQKIWNSIENRQLIK